MKLRHCFEGDDHFGWAQSNHILWKNIYSKQTRNPDFMWGGANEAKAGPNYQNVFSIV